jgi:hypothetical protein
VVESWWSQLVEVLNLLLETLGRIAVLTLWLLLLLF